MPKPPSHCTDVCRFDPAKRWCVGCGRTQDEIKAWRTPTPFRLDALARELPRRLERLARQRDLV